MSAGRNHCDGNCNVVGKWIPTALVDAFPGHSFWDVSDGFQSDAVRALGGAPGEASWSSFDRKLVRFSAKLLAAFRPNFWTIFGQKFGQFSAKTLSVFRPKNCPLFDLLSAFRPRFYTFLGPKLVRFPFFVFSFRQISA